MGRRYVVAPAQKSRHSRKRFTKYHEPPDSRYLPIALPHDASSEAEHAAIKANIVRQTNGERTERDSPWARVEAHAFTPT
jgi:hypothetical protein